MKNLFYTTFLSFLLGTAVNAQSSLFIDSSFTAEQMVADFFTNSCVTPSNVTFNGAPVAMGYFEAANTDLGLMAGIVLSTGDVTKLAQPSNVFATSSNNTPGDSDLDALIMFSSGDAAVLEFDITANEDGLLDFKYLFGSEEYPEYVGSSFNDVFAFFVTGPGGSGAANIAIVPGSGGTPVAINNVNEMTNAQYYTNYGANGGQHVVFDGLTTLLPAAFNAVAGTTYHVKIAVGDVGDRIFDSGVFIGIESLCGSPMLIPPAIAGFVLNGNTVTFTNSSRYATSWHWDFGDGASSDERHPAPHTYSAPGAYTITLTTRNWCCEDVETFTVNVSSVTATDEASAKPFTCYPNPASGSLFIEPENGQLMTLQLSNLTGCIVYRGTAFGKTEVPVGNLQPGLYTLALQNDNGVFVEKITVR